jgi:hypothetical protein
MQGRVTAALLRDGWFCCDEYCCVFVLPASELYTYCIYLGLNSLNSKPKYGMQKEQTQKGKFCSSFVFDCPDTESNLQDELATEDSCCSACNARV